MPTPVGIDTRRSAKRVFEKISSQDLFSRPIAQNCIKFFPLFENLQNPADDRQNVDFLETEVKSLNFDSPNLVSSQESEVAKSEVVEGRLIDLVAKGGSTEDASPFTVLALPSAASDRSGDNSNPALVYLAALAPSGRRTMRGKLESVCELLTGRKDLMSLPWHLLRYEHVAAIRSRLEEKGLAPASVNATLYPLRGVAKAAWNLQLLSDDDYRRIRNVSPVRGSRLPAGRSLSSGELAALLDACERGQHPQSHPS